MSDTPEISGPRKSSLPPPEERGRGNRRAFPRVPLEFPVRWGEDPKKLHPGAGYEISEGGLSFTTTATVALEAELEVHYQLEPKGDWVKVKGIVRHRSGDQVGVEFLSLRIADRLRIVDFLSAQTG